MQKGLSKINPNKDDQSSLEPCSCIEEKQFLREVKELVKPPRKSLAKNNSLKSNSLGGDDSLFENGKLTNRVSMDFIDPHDLKSMEDWPKASGGGMKKSTIDREPKEETKQPTRTQNSREKIEAQPLLNGSSQSKRSKLGSRENALFKNDTDGLDGGNGKQKSNQVRPYEGIKDLTTMENGGLSDRQLNINKDNEPIKEYLDVPWESMKKVSSIKKSSKRLAVNNNSQDNIEEEDDEDFIVEKMQGDYDSSTEGSSDGFEDDDDDFEDIYGDCVDVQKMFIQDLIEVLDIDEDIKPESLNIFDEDTGDVKHLYQLICQQDFAPSLIKLLTVKREEGADDTFYCSQAANAEEKSEDYHMFMSIIALAKGDYGNFLTH